MPLVSLENRLIVKELCKWLLAKAFLPKAYRLDTT
jgi:hypothetical protein